jgi:hypothetical protein
VGLYVEDELVHACLGHVLSKSRVGRRPLEGEEGPAGEGEGGSSIQSDGLVTIRWQSRKAPRPGIDRITVMTQWGSKVSGGEAVAFIERRRVLGQGGNHRSPVEQHGQLHFRHAAR